MDSRKAKWTEWQLLYLRENWLLFSNKKIALHLGHCVCIVRSKAYELGLPKKNTVWPEEAIKYLENNYRQKGNLELIQDLSRICEHYVFNQDVVARKLQSLKLKRTKAEMTKIIQRNKSMGIYKLRPEVVAKMTHPEGTVHWSEKMNCYVVKSPNGYVRYARWRYQQLHGALDSKHCVLYKDGNRRNISDDNLVAMTKSKYRKEFIAANPERWYSEARIAALLAYGSEPIVKHNVLAMHPQLIAVKRTSILLKYKLRKRN